MPEVGLFDAMYSARSLRRLKSDPVPEEIITRVLDAAIRAPSAGNAQNWIFIVVRDAEQRRRLGAIYRKASDIASEIYRALYEGELAYERRIGGASIYPAVQNIILACRAFGLGTVITTNHIRCEHEVKALLCLPSDVSTYALMPIGYPIGKFGPLTRQPVSEVAHADRWGVAWQRSEEIT
jgi:nitroreductase